MELLKYRICGKETTQINHAHLKTHGLTSKQYREMFPNDKMRILTEKQKNIAREVCIKRNKSEYMKTKVSNALKNKPKSEEHKQKLKKAKALEDKNFRAIINSNNRRGKNIQRNI